MYIYMNISKDQSTLSTIDIAAKVRGNKCSRILFNEKQTDILHCIMENICLLFMQILQHVMKTFLLNFDLKY